MRGIFSDVSSRHRWIRLPFMSTVATCVLASSAFAQSQDVTATADSNAQPAGETLAVVVVTAQFRQQNLQVTPIAITAVSGEQLEARGQTSIIDLSAQAPNVTLRAAPGPVGPALQAYIRGVGQSDFSYALEPGVGMYVDDVYYGTLTGSIFDLIDLDRVEILRGPQGTLAGQNSIGGAIKLYSRKPDGSGGGFAQAGYGSSNRIDVSTAADFTIVPDELFARISGVYKSQDGYVTRYDYACTHPGTTVPTFAVGTDCKLGTEGGREDGGVRALVRWTPSDRLEVNLIGDYTKDGSEATPLTLLYTGTTTSADTTGQPKTTIGGVQLGTSAGSPFISYSPYGNYALDTFSSSPYINYATYTDPNPVDGTAAFSIPPVSRVASYGGSADISYRLTDDMSVRSITAFQRYDSDWSYDTDTTPIGNTTVHNIVWHRQFSQELRLSGNLMDSAINYTLGGYYYDAKSHYDGRIDLRTFAFLENDYIPTTTKAMFANLGWAITDELELDGGIRYTKMSKTFSFGRLGAQGNTYPPCAAAGGTGVSPLVCPLNGVSGTFKGDRVDYRVSAQYQWTPNLMTYASFATGFKGGGVNPRPFFPSQVASFGPETLSAYEVGVKSEWLDDRARLNLALFYNNYNDIQVTVRTCDNLSPFPGAPCALPQNAGDATVKGAEFEATVNPTDHLSIEGSVSYMRFQFDTLSAAAMASGVTPDMKTPFAPSWKYDVNVQYDIPLSAWGTLTPRLDLNHTSSYDATMPNTSFGVVPGYTLLNGSLTWRSDDNDWRIALHVTNITDKLYYTAINDNRSSATVVTGVPARPREWLVTVRRDF